MKFKFYGKEYDSEKIDFINLFREKGGMIPLYSFSICQEGKWEKIKESTTADEIKIYEYYKLLKQSQDSLGFIEAFGINSNTFGAFINLDNAMSVEMGTTKFLKRKFLTVKFRDKSLIEPEFNVFTFKTKTCPKKSDKWDKMLNEFENKKASRFIAKYMKDYDLVKYLTAKRVQNNEYTIDKEVLKRALYTLRNDFVDQTEFCVSKSIDGVYNSIGIDDAFFNLLTFGVLAKVTPSQNEEYYILLNEKESNEILKRLKSQEKEVINKVYSMYKDTEKEKNREELFENMGEAMVEIYGPKVPEKIKIVKADGIEEEPEPGQE